MIDTAAIKTSMRRFIVYFDNSKKRRMGIPFQRHEAEGVEFSSRHVIIDSVVVKPDYATLQEMQDTLSHWGECQVHFIDE